MTVAYQQRPVPTVYLRKEKPSASAASSSAEQSSSAEGAGTSSSSSGEVSAAAASEIDAREFVEEVDLNKKLKATNFQELIGEEKWSEQLKGLQIIVEIIGAEWNHADYVYLHHSSSSSTASNNYINSLTCMC